MYRDIDAIRQFEQHAGDHPTEMARAHPDERDTALPSPDLRADRGDGTMSVALSFIAVLALVAVVLLVATSTLDVASLGKG